MICRGNLGRDRARLVRECRDLDRRWNRGIGDARLIQWGSVGMRRWFSLATVVMVSFSALLVVDDEEDEEELFEDGLSSPAVSVVGRCVGEDNPAL